MILVGPPHVASVLSVQQYRLLDTILYTDTPSPPLGRCLSSRGKPSSSHTQTLYISPVFGLPPRHQSYSNLCPDPLQQTTKLAPAAHSSPFVTTSAAATLVKHAAACSRSKLLALTAANFLCTCAQFSPYAILAPIVARATSPGGGKPLVCLCCCAVTGACVAIFEF